MNHNALEEGTEKEKIPKLKPSQLHSANKHYVPKSIIDLPLVINFFRFSLLHQTSERNGSTVYHDSEADSDTGSDMGMDDAKLGMVHSKEA